MLISLWFKVCIIENILFNFEPKITYLDYMLFNWFSANIPVRHALWADAKPQLGGRSGWSNFLRSAQQHNHAHCAGHRQAPIGAALNLPLSRTHSRPVYFLHRVELYFVKQISSRKGIPGRQCMLLAICELAKTPLEREAGLLEDILHLLLT